MSDGNLPNDPGKKDPAGDGETVIGDGAHVAALTAQLAAVSAERDAANAALETANEENRALSQARDALAAELEETKGEVAKAKKAASVAKVQQGKKARLFKAWPDGLSTADLLDRIRAAEAVEVVFCEGNREIMGVPPVVVAGEAWRKLGADLANPTGLLLTEPVLLTGPAGGAPFHVTGFALTIDGEPVGFKPRVNGQVSVGPGQRVRLEGDIIF